MLNHLRYHKTMQIVLTTDVLLAAYSQGLFPMAESAQSPYVHWYCPEMRGQLSISGLHIPKKLKKEVRQMKIKGKTYEIKIDSDFEATMEACADLTEDRKETWINKNIIEAYSNLHKEGFAHSVECWQNGEMVGGLYGVAIGGAFFGESMFSKETNASKVALVHLVARLHKAGFEILDTQFTNEHLEQFGVYEVTYKDYIESLGAALIKKCYFNGSGISEQDLVLDYLKVREDGSPV